MYIHTRTPLSLYLYLIELKFVRVVHTYVFVLIKTCQQYIFPTKVSAAQNEVALSYDRVRGLHFLAIIFAMTIV